MGKRENNAHEESGYLGPGLVSVSDVLVLGFYGRNGKRSSSTGRAFWTTGEKVSEVKSRAQG